MPAKPAYHHGNLRAALVAAALKEIARDGVGGFSLRGVARRAGVSAPAVYRHFADKDALLEAVGHECSERLAKAQATAIAAAAQDDPLEQFRAIGIALVVFAVEHPEHYRALCLVGSTMPDDGMRSMIEHAQRDGHIAPIPVDELILAANCTMKGLADQIIEGTFGKVDVARATVLATSVTRVLGEGLYPRSERPIDPRAAR